MKDEFVNLTRIRPHGDCKSDICLAPTSMRAAPKSEPAGRKRRQATNTNQAQDVHGD
jgi:hypothetical protein